MEIVLGITVALAAQLVQLWLLRGNEGHKCKQCARKQFEEDSHWAARN